MLRVNEKKGTLQRRVRGAADVVDATSIEIPPTPPPPSVVSHCTNPMVRPPVASSQVIFTGIQPTGSLHLGNYFGAIRPWARQSAALPKSGTSILALVDCHAITTLKEPADVNLLAACIHTVKEREAERLGVCASDQGEVRVYRQSALLTVHASIMWLLTARCGRIGDLSRQTQWKSKRGTGDPESGSTGLFTYPLLQAADIAVFQPTHVPVGEDQAQHLELSRRLFTSWNRQYATDEFSIRIPQMVLPPADSFSGRIMSLSNPTAKMSKSDPDPSSVIQVLDEPSVIATKVKRAVTDSTREVTYDPDERPGLANLLRMLAVLTDSTPEEAARAHGASGASGIKAALTDALVAELTPVRLSVLERMQDEQAVADRLADDAAALQARAQHTYHQMATSAGLAPL